MSKEIKNLPKDFNLNHQWGLFLERCGISAILMPADQEREMKRAFFGACGQLLLVFRDELNDYADKKGEIEAAMVMQNMLDQVSDYWQKETDKHTGKAN
jgi:hypothetical protein